MALMDDDSANDLFRLMTGDKLGEGQYRNVFVFGQDATKVLKQDTGLNFSNINEFQIWQEYQDTKIGKWLAPVFAMGPRGLWLIQARTTPIPQGRFPKRIPAIFSDTKVENWGLLDGRPVCHDYGNHNVFALAREGASKIVPTVFTHVAPQWK